MATVEGIGMVIASFIAIVLIFCFLDKLASSESLEEDKNEDSSNPPDEIIADERVTAAYDASRKSLKLNLMQMEAFRQMSDIAQKRFRPSNKHPSDNNWFDRKD